MSDSLTKSLKNVYERLTGNRNLSGNIIRVHSKRLQELGDISFPLKVQNWHGKIAGTKCSDGPDLTIFNCSITNKEALTASILALIGTSWEGDLLCYSAYKTIKDDLHLFFERESTFETCICYVHEMGSGYGSSKKFRPNSSISIEGSVGSKNLEHLNLTELRAVILRDVLANFLQFMTTTDDSALECQVNITLSSNVKNQSVIACGPILGEKGFKDATTTALDLYNKRSSDMQMMAQHKYQVQVKQSSNWKAYFEGLGRAAVTIEMLQNKPHKSCKITLNNLESANKGAAFIFYNCARLTALFKEFDNRVSEDMYLPLPPLKDVDYSLLSQPEEWELLYVYILQFPLVVRNCVNDFEKGSANPQYIIQFLSSLCSVFSSYYRRVKILTTPKEHLLPVLHARICLLKALQQVFHNALFLLNIEPISEM